MRTSMIHPLGRSRATLVVLLLVAPLAFSMMGGAYINHPDGRTGAPGEQTCQACHDQYALNSGDGYVMLSGTPEKYLPGQSYILTVTVYSPGMTRFCFEFTIVSQDSDQPTGSWTCIDAEEACVSGKYIKTSRNGCDGGVNGMKTWQVEWNSPSKAESPLTFYGVGMGSNADNDEDGDCTYTCMMTLYPAPKLPDKPSGIIVEPGDCHVALSWYMSTETDPAGGPLSYNIYWSDSVTGGLEFLTTVAEPEYVHYGLMNGHTYRYQISGANAEGEGPLSNVVTAKPDLVPSEPRHLATASVAYNEIQLTWDPPTDWGSGGAKSFTVLRGETPWDVSPIASGINQASYIDEGPLAPNTEYYYRVQAVNDRGGGGVATISVFVPATPPSFPLDLSLMVRKGEVELNWQAPMEDGGDPVCYYRVYRSAPGEAPELIKDLLSETNFVDTDTLPDVTYEYTVAAVNGAGEGSLSTPVEAYIVPPPSSGDTSGVDFEGIPLSGLVVVGAVIIIGAVMVGRLSHATSLAERKDED